MGRAKGTPKTGGAVKGKSSQRAKLLEQIGASGKDGPVEVLLKEMWNDKTEDSVKRKIAEVLLPYIERKQPQAIEQKNMNSFEGATEEELLKRLREINVSDVELGNMLGVKK